ncbi:unnamed protein product [Heligmosomoides polygyrus]|uniref:Astacin domain-containing protein n=1 Tax=Heligmosomoides polygyrus TaxID=6339 RepID=A0A183GLU7_HELPZ|nr:unnamed protein product [Heligmosomoides polygyrus]
MRLTWLFLVLVVAVNARPKFKENAQVNREDWVDRGDSINEINERAHVDENLFQGDIVLTGDQAEELVEDIQKSMYAENRSKRQAYKGGRYPKLLWSRGVNYFFNETISERAKQVFLKAVNLWQKDTCINFYHNPYGKINKFECVVNRS